MVVEKVKLIDVLKDVNEFSNSNVPEDHCPKAVCFSNPVEGHTCDPAIPNPNGVRAEAGTHEGACGIYHACHVYFAARLGVGLNPDIDFEYESDEWLKALAFAKKLTWPKLQEAINLILKGGDKDIEQLGDESDAEKLEAQEAVVASINTKPKVRTKSEEKKETIEKKESKIITVRASDADPDTMKRIFRRGLDPSFDSLIDKMAYKPNSMGYDILNFLRVSPDSDLIQICEYVKKYYSKTKKVEILIQQCCETGVLIESEGTYRFAE